MNPKTILYFSLFFSVVLALALGGWLVKGAKALKGQRQETSVRPRFA